MKKLALAFVVMLLAVTRAHSQEDRIAVWGDAAGADCSVAAAGGAISIYILHESVAGAINSVWSAPIPSCAAVAYASESYPAGFLGLGGDSQTGFGLQYSGQCKPGTILICTINGTSTGTTPPCCFYPVLDAPFVEPNYGKIHARNCSNTLIFPITADNHGFNLDSTCDCTVPTESSTWGAVKALYN